MVDDYRSSEKQVGSFTSKEKIFWLGPRVTSGTVTILSVGEPKITDRTPLRAQRKVKTMSYNYGFYRLKDLCFMIGNLNIDRVCCNRLFRLN